MGLKEKLGMPYGYEKRTGHNGKEYRIYKYPPEEKQWKEMGIIFGIAFWGLIVFALISNNI